MISRAPGIEDIFPDRINRWNLVTEAARDIFSIYNYKEIIIPVMEFTELFVRGLGDETDIVTKEMFTFEDRGGRSLTLRPEGTASVVRAYVENGDYNRLSSCKLFYVGPMFRAERPQRGRLRQFNQFGAEFFGSQDPFYDYEIIAMMNSITEAAGIENYTLIINSIGCPKCRPPYITALKEYYSGKEEKLCEDCRKRLDTNPLRILDCKKDQCSSLKDESPAITGFLCNECADHYSLLKNHLNRDGIAYTEDPHLVRGLDYYTRSIFEFVSGKLGGQNAFAAGGRYDNLVEQFGGSPTPAVGFAAGIERILLLIEDKAISSRGPDIYFIHSGGRALEKALVFCGSLRKAGYSADLDPSSKGFKSQFKKADREKALFTIVIGDDEVAAGSLTVKELSTGVQESIEAGTLMEYMAQKIAR